MRDDHVKARVAATNQLAALLSQHWPGAAAIFGRLDSEIALAFLERYPTPASSLHLGEARLAGFLRRHSYCGRRSAGELLSRLHGAPQPAVSLDPDVVGKLVQAQVRLLRTLLGTISLGQLVAKLGPLLERTPSADQAAALCGAAPVTKRSGQHRAVCFRHASNAKARKALTIWADNSRHASPWTERTYRDARGRGCRHPHAIRILARAWLRVIWTCWHTNTPHDPERKRHREAPSLT